MEFFFIHILGYLYFESRLAKRKCSYFAFSASCVIKGDQEICVLCYKISLGKDSNEMLRINLRLLRDVCEYVGFTCMMPSTKFLSDDEHPNPSPLFEKQKPHFSMNRIRDASVFALKTNI